ncbi:predicted protein, partial [Thalassiosira pseudonana CCMP1335]
MLRGSSNENIDDTQGLGPHLVGKQLEINGRSLSICKQLGEGGFSFVYLVKDRDTNNAGGSSVSNGAAAAGDGDSDNNVLSPNIHRPQHLLSSSSAGSTQTKRSQRSSQKGGGNQQLPPPIGSTLMVLKITSVHNGAQRHMAEKEAKLLQTLSHPSIVTVYDHGFRDPNQPNVAAGISSGGGEDHGNNKSSDTASVNGSSSASGGAKNNNNNHGISGSVIAFGQICNAVSYLHAQRPPIIHRDLKPVNFLIKNGSYKLCDFGSAVLGHTDLQTPENRRKAEEVVQKTTTQMFRAPEMVDLYMAKRLTQSTDVWALGCCLYSLAFLKDCFEEGSNLAILSRKYNVPKDNPYGEGVVDLIDRMLTVDYKERADMSEVIMCLSALYSNRPLPKRKKKEGKKKEEGDGKDGNSTPRVGAYRTDGQGIRGENAPAKETKVVEAKKLNPNSAAAKRKKASEVQKKVDSIASTQLSGSGSIRREGKTTSASVSVRSETPCSDTGTGDFSNFASFDHVFEEGSFDPFHSNGDDDDGFVGERNAVDDHTFSSAFDDQCHLSQTSSSHSGANNTRNRSTVSVADDVNSSFEVTFQGFDSSLPSAFSTDDHNFFHGEESSGNNDDGFGDLDSSFGNDDAMQPQEKDSTITNGKKK